MNIVVSDPKSRKAYSKKIDSAAAFSGRKIGEEVELGIIGLDGYKARITGGSDNEGFPMKHDLSGTSRKTVWTTFDSKRGERGKVARHGNTVSEEISQLNLVVTKDGSKSLEELLGTGKKTEEKVSIKEQAIKESLENVGNVGGDSSMLKKGKH
ncbi:30S ribosomal protein S6e [uncultured archaeon]|nr:30S ribosomal protein S6e [uncultured archaeon]